MNTFSPAQIDDALRVTAYSMGKGEA